jgi:hypothetical protein
MFHTGRPLGIFVLGLILGFGVLRLWPVGVGPALVGFWIALRLDSQERATLAGTYLVGIGVIGFALLSPIVWSSRPCTNPATTSCYSPETMPVLVAFGITGSVGLVVLVLGLVSNLKSRHG